MPANAIYWSGKSGHAIRAGLRWTIRRAPDIGIDGLRELDYADGSGAYAAAIGKTLHRDGLTPDQAAACEAWIDSNAPF